jgi:hypothetical protein
MKTALLLLISLTLQTAAANAEPRHHWYKDKTNWALLAVAVASSLYATHEIHNCRTRNDLIHCPDGGYGEFRAREELRGGTSIGLAFLSIYGREHWRNGWKDELLNDMPTAAFSSWNVIVGRADQTTPTFPRNPEYQNPTPWKFQVTH